MVTEFFPSLIPLLAVVSGASTGNSAAYSPFIDSKTLSEDEIHKPAIGGFKLLIYTRFACGHKYVQRSTGHIMVTSALNIRLSYVTQLYVGNYAHCYKYLV